VIATFVRRRRLGILVGLAATLAAAAANATDGQAAAEAPAIPGVPGGPPLTPGENAEDTYQLNYVGMVRTTSGGYNTPKGYVPKTSFWEGYRGKYRQKLGPVEFYDAVGRSDLHGPALRRVALRVSLGLGGASFIFGGMIYIVKDAFGETPHFHPAGGYFIGGGLVMLLVTGALDQQPVTEDEAVRMVRDYNDRLRAQLGLPPVVEDPTAPAARAPAPKRSGFRLALFPSLADHGGGLVLGGSF